jgi:UDP-GlcNAc3NAcA epimerase
MKVLSIIGARPQFIKSAVVSKALKEYDINEILVNTGQHYDYNMSDVFLKNLNMQKPHYNLNVGSGKHGEMTAAILKGCEKLIIDENPDKLIVYGDTNSTLAGALAAAKLKVPVAHIEAGIRMLPKDMPEEINRVLVDRISSDLFCPTVKAVNNLKLENIKKGVYLSGDVMYDLFLQMKPSFNTNITDQLKLKGKYILITIHRDYNVDNKEKLEKILESLNDISEEYSIVFPIHPRTKKMVEQFSLSHYLNRFIITEPLSYSEIMGLVLNCEFLVTDSGGLQKESYFAGKRALVLMPDTGWAELTDCGINVLADEDNLTDTISEIVKPKSFISEIFGKGNSSQIIAETLAQN